MSKKKTETNEEIKETSKPTTAKERVKIELDELTERNEKLGNLLGKIKSDNWEAHQKLLNSLNGEQKKLLAKQYMIQKNLCIFLNEGLKFGQKNNFFNLKIYLGKSDEFTKCELCLTFSFNILL